MTHYYSEKQDSEFLPYLIKVGVFDDVFEIYSAKGVFSKDELDFGSKLLIENAIIKNKGSVLDFGCGNGVIGISIAKQYDVTVTMSDINERAVKLAKINNKLHKIKAKAVKSDVFSNIKEKFDTILLNPPQTAGKKLCFQMISESKNHLNKNGTLQIVARRRKGGETLAKHMESTFENVQSISKKGGFYVYLSELSS